MEELQKFIYKIFSTVKPMVVIFSAIGSYLIIPAKCFEVWSIGLWVAVALDLFTRWIAIFVKNGGIIKGIIPAINSKAFNSDTLYRKTAIKVIAYLVIQILTGLSFRMAISPVNLITATVIYNFLFCREFISNIENLIDAGFKEFNPILLLLKKKEKNILKGKKG